jgi:signal transduction histidine kinase
MFVGRNFVLTPAHDEDICAVAPVHAEVARNPRLLKKGPAWVAHAILDRLVDEYLPLVDRFDDQIEAMEVQILEGRDSEEDPMRRLMKIKRSLQMLRRVAIHQREILLRIVRAEFDEVPNELTPFFRDILRDIADEDRRAGEVIRRLRALLRRGETPRQPLDINDVTSEVLRLARSELLGHGVMVSTQLAPALPKVRGDRVALQQVLLNLIVNACDAMRQDEPPRRELTVATALDGDGAVRVAIADRGAGITADGVERVFEPFFTTKENGLGLGLVICRSIVAAHGGHLGAVNNADRGATFWFTLPRDS